MSFLKQTIEVVVMIVPEINEEELSTRGKVIAILHLFRCLFLFSLKATFPLRHVFHPFRHFKHSFQYSTSPQFH
jgi:hypothetical protein